MVNAMLGNYEQAVSDLKTSKTISAEPQTRLELAKTYLKMERYEDAITELESLISGEQAGGQFALQARRILEQVYSQLNREDSLRRFYQKMLTQIPESFYWYRQAANFAFSQQQYQQARELYSKALDNSKLSDGFDVSALEGYLQTYLAEDKYESLFEEAGEYLDTEAAYIVFYKMAQAKVEMDDVSGAVEYFKKAISEASANQDIVVSILQSMYNSLGQEQVLKICSEKLQANPDSLAANFVMFNLSKINGEYNQALNYIDKCIEQVSSDKNRMNSYLIQKVTVLQAAYNKTGDKNYLTEAVKLYKSMLEDMPNNVIVQNNLAYLLADNEIDLKKALEYAENVYQRMPDNPNFLDTYAYVLYQNEKFEKAEQIIQAAVQNTEQGRTQYSYEIYEHMGMIKAKLGKKEQAKQAYQMAIDIIKNSDRQDKDEVAERLELEIKKL
jgi:tetratricopeptide (TPR) repeat protein